MKTIIIALIALMAILTIGILVVLVEMTRHQGTVYHYEHAQGQFLSPHSQGNYYATPPQQQTSPTQQMSDKPVEEESLLAIPMVYEAFKKLYQAKWLNSDFSLAKELTLNQVCALASCIMDEVGMEKNTWKPFEDMWNVHNLRSCVNRSLTDKNSIDVRDEVLKILHS